MKKIFLLLTLTLVLGISKTNAQCAYTYTQNGSTVTFNHMWPIALIYSLDSVRINFGDGNSTLHVLPVPTSTTHTYASPGTYNACLTRYLSQLGQPGVIICNYCDSINIGTTSCNTTLAATSNANTITAVAIGSFGTPPYTYSYTLNPGNITNTTGIFTGVALGVYSICATATDAFNQTCTVDCDSISAGISFVCNTTLALSTNGSTVNAIATTTGGTAPYTYNYTLNPGNITNSTGVFTGLANGSYTVCVTSNDAFNNLCSTACDTITVGQTSNCNTAITTNVVGSNIAATATATGGSGPYTFTYTLNPGNITNATGLFTGVANGSYAVCATATDAQNITCSTSCDSVVVGNTIPGGCTINASFSESITGLSVNFTNNTSISNGTILGTNWFFGDGNTSMTSSPAHTYAAAGSYNVILIVNGIDSLQNPCVDSATKMITVGPSSLNATQKNTLKIFPNPTQDYFTVNIPNNELLKNLTITDVAGRNIDVDYQEISANMVGINLKNQASGIYFIKLQTLSRFYTSTIMKQE